MYNTSFEYYCFLETFVFNRLVDFLKNNYIVCIIYAFHLCIYTIF